jgi:hypothetical protein
MTSINKYRVGQIANKKPNDPSLHLTYPPPHILLNYLECNTQIQPYCSFSPSPSSSRSPPPNARPAATVPPTPTNASNVSRNTNASIPSNASASTTTSRRNLNRTTAVRRTARPATSSAVRAVIRTSSLNTIITLSVIYASAYPITN